MYKAQQSEAGGGGSESGGGKTADDNVVDAEFSEVDENKKGAA
jgi:molecular chaperone DnaK